MQFSLKSVLLCLTLACIAVGLFPRTMVAMLVIVLPTSLIVAAVYALLRFLGRRFDPETFPSQEPAGSYILLSASLWTIAFVLIGSLITESWEPSSATPKSILALLLFGLRVGTLMLMIVSPIASCIVGIRRLSSGIPAKTSWLVVAVVSYILAWLAISYNIRFIPLA